MQLTIVLATALCTLANATPAPRHGDYQVRIDIQKPSHSLSSGDFRPKTYDDRCTVVLPFYARPSCLLFILTANQNVCIPEALGASGCDYDNDACVCGCPAFNKVIHECRDSKCDKESGAGKSVFFSWAAREAAGGWLRAREGSFVVWMAS